MVAVISVMLILFLAFPDLTYHLEDTGIGVLPDSKETEFGNQEASPSAGKNTGVVLVPCVPTATSGGVDISEVPGCHLL